MEHAEVVKIGDAIQWHINGQDQFPSPKPVIKVDSLDDVHFFCFVEGMTTGIPVEQVTVHKPDVAAIWGDHAEYLADHALKRLAVRTDRWGAIGGKNGKPGWYMASGELTRDVLIRHFCGAAPTDTVGVLSLAPDSAGECWSRWTGTDIDWHKPEPAPAVNWTAAKVMYDTLVALGFRPVLEDSNGRGGYHVWTLFAEPIRAETARSFGLWLTRDWKAWGLEERPEVFPKQARVSGDECGNFLRLWGRHFRDPSHWSKIWNGSQWLEGEDAIDYVVGTVGDDPVLIPAEAASYSELPPPRTRSGGRRGGRCGRSARLDWLKAKLGELSPELAETAISWSVKPYNGDDILVGVCPFVDQHDSGESHNGDLSAGFHDGKPYVACLHRSCRAIPKINRLLFKQTRIDQGNEDNDDPHVLARLHRQQQRHLRNHSDSWLRWDTAAYSPMSESEIHAALTRTIKAEFLRLNQAALKFWEEETNAENKDT
jgi:hypothetical protein